MKTKFFSLIILAAIVIFTGCSKNDDANPSLKGTSWEQLNDGVSVKLIFQTTIDCQIVISSPETSSAYVTNFSYEYEHPNVRMYPKLSGIAELKGVINGKLMNVINTSTGKTAYTFTKQ